MRLLLDTDIFLWYIGGDARVGPQVRAAIEDAEAAFLSVVSVWEAAIKYQIRKLPLPEPPHPWISEQRQRHGIESLPSMKRRLLIYQTSNCITAIRSIASSSVRKAQPYERCANALFSIHHLQRTAAGRYGIVAATHVSRRTGWSVGNRSDHIRDMVPEPNGLAAARDTE